MLKMTNTATNNGDAHELRYYFTRPSDEGNSHY